MAWGKPQGAAVAQSPSAGIEQSPTVGTERSSTADAAWIVAVPCALATAAAILFLTSPLASVLLPSRPGITLLPEDAGRLTPEPREITRYLIALGGPVLLAVATILLTRAPAWRRRRRRPAVAVLAAQAAAIGFVAVCFAGQHAHRWTYAYFTFATLAVAAGLAGCFVLVAPRVWAHMGTRRIAVSRRRRWRWVAGAAVAALTALWLMPGINSEASVTWSFLYHEMAFYVDETFAILNGLTPLANFHAQYASLLPYFIGLSLLTFGKTLLVFTITVCAISVLVLGAIYGVLRRAARSTVVALVLYVPFLATTLFNPEGLSYLRFTPGTYFPMFPFRYASGYLLAWLLARQLDRPGQRRTWMLFTAGGIAAFNNFEFGVPAIVAVVVALLMTGIAPRRQELARLAGEAAAGLLIAFAAMSVLTLARAGSLPDLGEMAHYSHLYAVSGYSVAPIPGTLGLPLIIYATYAAAIATAVVRAIDGASNRVLTGLLAWTGIFGLGTASYYVVRANWSLMPITFSAWVLALALLTLCVVETIRADERWRPGLAGVAVLFGVGLAACSVAQFPFPWSEVQRIRTPPPQVNPAPIEWSVQPTREPYVRWFTAATLERRGRFSIRRGAPIALFVTTGHRIADAYGVVDVVPFTGPQSMHTLGDFEEALDALRAAHGTSVLLPKKRVPVLHRVLERRGFRLVVEGGIRATPMEGDQLPADAAVVNDLTRWVDVRDVRAFTRG